MPVEVVWGSRGMTKGGGGDGGGSGLNGGGGFSVEVGVDGDGFFGGNLMKVILGRPCLVGIAEYAPSQEDEIEVGVGACL